jgi:hypothetical protein
MSEEYFVENLLASNLTFPWRTKNPIRYLREVKITSNRTDVIYFEIKNNEVGFITAIEAKLQNWQKALQQATRNKLFANRVYVAVPEKYSTAPMANISYFREASVGLIILHENNMAKVYFHPPLNTSRSLSHVRIVESKIKAFALA